jgi:NAD(P)-dependent dehydrogenase (short-subunit alcohol dehydrogenase family)
MPLEKDSNQVVLITGSSSGIGQKTALEFAKAGYSIIITYYEDKSAGEKTVNECLKLGASKADLYFLDLNNDQSINDFSVSVIKQHPEIDILVNNAGFLIRDKLVDQTFGQIDQQIKANLTGAIKLTKLFLPVIKKSVISVASNLGLIGKENLTVYCASKFGLRGFSQSLALEQPNLKVYAINPSLTATKMGSPSGMDPQIVAKMIFKAATGQYRAKSGSDINVRDYLYGENFRIFISILRKIKRNLGL